jgi:hypothetical protein
MSRFRRTNGKDNISLYDFLGKEGGNRLIPGLLIHVYFML